MGMYDEITILMPLPDGNTQKDFQTKSLVRALDRYEIREDGTLWHEEYDVEDHSDPNKSGIGRFLGIATRVNHHWVRDNFTGEIRFYNWDSETQELLEYIVFFIKGKLLWGPLKI